MSLPWPGFLRRRALLERARLALLRDDLAAALEALTQRVLHGDPEATELVARALDRLAARASGEAGAADTADGESDAALALLARHAPERALAIQRELVRRAEAAQPRGERISSLL